MILHRLLQALVREQLIPPQHVKLKPPLLYIQLSGNRSLQASIQRVLSFGRFDMDDIHMIDSGDRRAIKSSEELLDLVREEGWIQHTKQYERFRDELRNSEENHILALAAAENQRQSLEQTSIQWVEDKLARDNSFSSLIFYEQCVIEGHPLHPGAKIKMGMSKDDVIRYSPEFGAQPDVKLAAVRKECAVSVCTDEKSVTDFLYDEYEGLEERVRNEIGEAAGAYELIPLHPWQWEHTIPALYKSALERKDLILLRGSAIPTAALMSFRSLAPLGRRIDNKHHIKTAVNVQTTGAIRTVSPNSVENGPVLSRLLRGIQHKEQYFENKFRILEEQAGIYYNPSEKELSQDQQVLLRKNAAAILRENPEQFIESGEVMMPCAALIAQSPFQNKPIVAEAIERFASTGQVKDNVVSFLAAYAEICIPPMLTLMSKYGISMEGHLQNSIIVLDKGEPSRLFIRDFGGVRVLEERLRKQGMNISFYEGSAIRAKNGEDLWNKTFYPVFQNHFGELIACLVRYFDVSEEQLWRPVAAVCRRAFSLLKKDEVTQAYAKEDEAALFAPDMDLKAMTSMRLKGDVTDYTFAKVRNPLAEAEL